jgi:hypothetical protein
MSNNSNETYDVFLSHSHSDAAFVEGIARELEDNNGLKVWLDKWNLVPGDLWVQELAKGFEAAKTCAVFVGAKEQRGWFKQEIQKALNRQAKSDSFRVIPVLLPGSDPDLMHAFLDLRDWIDFREETGRSRDESLYYLVCGIKGVRPGRYSSKASGQTERDKKLIRELKRLQYCRQQGAIDDDVAFKLQYDLFMRSVETG